MASLSDCPILPMDSSSSVPSHSPQPDPLGILPSLAQVQAASHLVYAVMPPTAQYEYPLLTTRLGVQVWVKHENHTPLGAFKIRGGLVYMHHLIESRPQIKGVITATKGNHGQSVALAARRYGLKATIVVPTNNSQCTNRAMKALGADVIPFGGTFAEAIAEADRLALHHAWHPVPGFHPWLLQGVATGSLELLQAVRDLDAVYVPIGKGTGICSMIAMRNALGLKTEIIGVAAENAPAYALAFETGVQVSSPAKTLACGIAVSDTDATALAVIRQGASRIITVSEIMIQRAMAAFYHDTHNVACGAGAASLAAVMTDCARDPQGMARKRVAVILSGSNVDLPVWAGALAAHPEDPAMHCQ